MNASETNTMSAQPANRSGSALAIFLFFALPMPACLFIYHIFLWFNEQSAIASLSLKSLAWAGPIGSAVQALMVTAIAATLWRFTNDDRFKPVYACIMAAAAIGFPALLLRTLGPNDDQIGSMMQFALAIIAMLVVLRVRKNLDWNRGGLPFGFLIAGIGIAPLVIYGSFGSIGDALLSLLAAVAFGLLAAALLPPTTGSIWLDATGIGAVLALLATALGYDGAQLILVVLIPAFSLAIAAVMPSRAAASAAIGALAFAGLALFDPTELTIVLGDILNVAMKALGIALLLGWGTSLIALILRSKAASGSGSRTKRAVGWAGAVVVWMFLIALFFSIGHPGDFGDRLFVILKEQADLSSIVSIKDRNQRMTAAYQQLTELATKSQADLRKHLDSVGVQYTPYYLEDAMEVRGGTLIRLYLMTRTDIDRVIASPHLRAVAPDLAERGDQPAPPPDYIGWNITMIGADKVWTEFNVRGAGIVVGQSDTGVDGSHPAIRAQYRGFNGSDEYNWYDPWSDTISPHDEIGHGTHTMGTILGKDGIGVAPDAQWIGCVNLDRNLGNPAWYLNCMQFMLAPFPHGGDPFKDGDPTKAVDVMNNSWGCPALEGCDANALKVAAQHLRDAGIFVVVSTGNDGPLCSTVESPLSLYDSVLSVGAINANGNVADFSSRGPVTADGSGRVKPEIVAPGVDILSSTPLDSYAKYEGTSMAGPHVVGVVALIWSAQPALIGDIDGTEKLILDTARPYAGETSSGCFSGGNPNNAYGYGVVDAYAAVKKALGK